MSAARLPHPLSPEVVDLLSRRMALVGDATRIRILDQLRGGEKNVQAIADALLTTQQNVSGHLRLLRAGRVVSRRSAGREVFYAVTDETVFDAWERLIAGLQPRRE
jgi:DNA-binding transcriptional ArsR family regulator